MPARYPARTAWNCISSDNKHAAHRGRAWHSIWVSHTTEIVLSRYWGSRCNPALEIALDIASALNCSLVPPPNSSRLPDTPRNLAALHISSPFPGSSRGTPQSNVSSSHVYNAVHQLYIRYVAKQKKHHAREDTRPQWHSARRRELNIRQPHYGRK